MDTKELFDALDLRSIRGFLETGREEDLHLEFKTVSVQPFNKDDKKNYAKALSGFANSDGGIVVWGVDARKNPDGVDVASKTSPIGKLAKFVSDLNSLTGEFVSPIVNGVLHKKILEGQNTGYAASLIPASDIGPHMARAGENRYYKRSGDSFYVMEHFDLEDMFGRRAKPHLVPWVEGPSFTDFRDAIRVEFIVSLRNTGRGVAKFPYIALEIDAPFEVSEYGLDGNIHHGLPRLPQPPTTRVQAFGGSSDIIVYPDSELAITIIRAQTKAGTALPGLRIQYRIGCEGVQMKTGVLEVPVQIMKRMLKQKP